MIQYIQTLTEYLNYMNMATSVTGRTVRRQIVDIIQDIVAKLNFTFTIQANVDNGDGTYTLSSCNTFNLRPPCKITIDSKVYKIVSFVQDVSITIKDVTAGAGQPGVTTFPIPAPFYFHGTWLATQSETSQVDGDAKYPMVYLNEQIIERFGDTELDAIDRTSELRMYFLDLANFEDWKTDDHYTYVIKPMRDLMANFVFVLKEETGIGEIEDYVAINRIKFGTYVEKGYEKKFFSDNVSGVELRITIPFKTAISCATSKC